MCQDTQSADEVAQQKPDGNDGLLTSVSSSTRQDVRRDE